MKIKDEIKTRGDVEGIIEYKDGRKETKCFHNAILRKGREALASSLANEFGSEFNFFINRMLFGDGGTVTGTPKFVEDSRNGLFGVTQVIKPILSTIDVNNPTQVVFTSVVAFSEGNGFTLNEIALQMNDGDLYSMATFAGIAKTSQMQITWNWRLSFI